MTSLTEVVNNTPVSLLGESPIWHPTEATLYWIDITGKKLYRYNLQEEVSQTFNMEWMIGAVVPASGRYSVIVAMENGIHGITSDDKLEQLTGYPGNEINNNRFNDGKCDPLGRFWVGTMNKELVSEAGNLYAFDGKLLELKQSGVTISNGIAWSADALTMYYIDTFEYAVFAYDYVSSTGNIFNRRIAVKIPFDAGAPDGMTIDSNGMLWVAHWGGFAVRCWNPGTGEMVEEVYVPVPNVTSCTFGNQDLKTLYVTTAKEGLSKRQYQDYPLSGSIFKISMKAKGIHHYLFQSAINGCS